MKVIEAIQNKRYSNDSKVLEQEIATVLEDNGYAVTKQFLVSDRGDGRPGKVDIVCGNGSAVLAIEIDWKSPRKKSIFKLKSLPDDVHKLIILRSPFKGKKPDGIEVISVNTKEQHDGS